MSPPEKISRFHKKDTSISRSTTTFFPSNSKEQILDDEVGPIGGTVAISSDFFGDLQKLYEQTKAIYIFSWYSFDTFLYEHCFQIISYIDSFYDQLFLY